MTNEHLTEAPCVEPDDPHTVWWWREDGGPPVPFTTRVLSHADALALIEPLEPGLPTHWAKAFPVPGGEHYTCLRWTNPDPPVPPEPEPIVLPPPRRPWWARLFGGWTS